MKFCNKCQCDTERYKSGDCKPCASRNNKAWQARNPGRMREIRLKWRNANRDREREANRKRYLENTDAIKAASAKWAKEHPEAQRIYCQNKRARRNKAEGKLSSGLSDKLFAIQKGMCACGCARPLGAGFHMDHRMPLALGGTNTDDNMQLLRAECNRQKGAKHPIDFMQQRGFLL